MCRANIRLAPMSAKPNTDETHEQSFGVIPIQKKKNETSETSETDDILFLVIKHRNGHWAFPKGHANVGETDVETARRELREETGIKEVTLNPKKAFEERYSKPKWREPNKIVIKTVRYFLGEVTNPTLKLQASEISDARWVPYAEARKLITFDAGRELLDEVAKVLGIL